MKLINSALIVITVLCMYGCSTTSSLVKCPDFKSNKKSVLKIARTKPVKTKRKLAIVDEQTKNISLKKHGIIKRLNKRKIEALNDVVADIKLPTKPQFNLESELLAHIMKFNVGVDVETSANASKKALNKHQKAEKLLNKITVKLSEASSPNNKVNQKSKKQFFKKLSKKPTKSYEERIEPLAIFGLISSLVSLVIFGIPLGLLGAILGVIGYVRITENPGRRGKGLAIIAILLGLISAILVLIILS